MPNQETAESRETIFIGDIHGCAEEFNELLKLIPHRESRLILLGDLVNKGPDPSGVIRQALSLDCECLKGNHDADHLHWAEVDGYHPKPDTITTRAQMSAQDYDDYLDFIRRMPLYLDTPDFVAVHAAVLPDTPLAAQPEKILTGETTLENSWQELIDFGRPLVVGHKRYSEDQGVPFIDGRRFFGLDTACVYGGTLTALSLPSGRIWQVKARRKYAELH